MSELNPLDPRIADIERRLAALSPRDPRLNVAELLFSAGRESALQEQTRWRVAWPLVTAASLMLSVVLTATVVRRPAERIVYVDRPVVLPDTEADDATDQPRESGRSKAIRPRRDRDLNERFAPRPELGYLHARQLALEFGVDSLPRTTTVVSNGNPLPLRYGDWRRGLDSTGLPFAETGQGMIEDPTDTWPGFRGGSS